MATLLKNIQKAVTGAVAQAAKNPIATAVNLTTGSNAGTVASDVYKGIASRTKTTTPTKATTKATPAKAYSTPVKTAPAVKPTAYKPALNNLKNATNNSNVLTSPGSTSALPKIADYLAPNLAVETSPNDAMYYTQPEQMATQFSDEQQPGVTYRPTPTYDAADDISNWGKQALNSELAQIKSAYDQSRAGINSQLQTIPEKYNNLRNQNDIIAEQERQKMLAATEQSGGYRGGEQLAGQGQLSTARLQNLSNLYQQQQTQENALNTQLTDLDNQEAQARISAESGIDSEALEKIIQASQDSANNAIATAQLTGSLNGMPTLAAQTQAYNQEQDSLNNQIKAIAAYSNNYQAEIDRRMAINPNDPLIPYLQAARQRKLAGVSDLQLAQQESQLTAQQIKAAQLENEARSIANRYSVQIAQGQIDEQKLKNTYQQLVNQGYSKDQAADLAAKYASISQGNAQIDISRQKLVADNFNNIISQIDSIYTAKDPYTNQVTVTNPSALRAYILSLKLPQTSTDQLLTRYGLSTN
ncbi:MAG: hypothetical protein ACM3KR_00695 [Deltaproteobacteria bacterium]